MKKCKNFTKLTENSIINSFLINLCIFLKNIAYLQTIWAFEYEAESEIREDGAILYSLNPECSLIARN